MPVFLFYKNCLSSSVAVLDIHETLLEYTKRAAEFIPDVRMVELPDLKRDVKASLKVPNGSTVRCVVPPPV